MCPELRIARSEVFARLGTSLTEDRSRAGFWNVALF